MGFLQIFWRWIKSSPLKSHKKWHQDLNPIDIQNISTALNLKENAHRLGAAGVPGQTDQNLAGPESAVVLKIEEVRKDYMAWGQLRLASLNQELARKDVTQQINQARKLDEEFERMADNEMAKFTALCSLRDTARNRQNELDQFKRANNLERLPVVPERSKKRLIVVIAFALVGVEAFLNMSLFAKGLDTGLLGGFFEAATAAFVNVVVSFACGVYLIRFVHHVKPLPKLFGFMAIAVTACFIVTMAFGIAHYRNALSMGGDNAMSLALQTLLTSPIGLNEMSSWLLFFVSLIFGVIAIVDGYKMDDPYPGYGNIFRLADDAIEDYNAEIDELRSCLEDIKKDTLAQIENTASQSEASVGICKNLIGEKARSGNDLANAVATTENALHTLLQEFRDENKIARGAAPTPAYFNTWPTLREMKMPDFSTSIDEIHSANQRQLLATFLGEIQEIRARIQTAFNTRFNSLQMLDSHLIAQQISMNDSILAPTIADDVAAVPGNITPQGAN